MAGAASRLIQKEPASFTSHPMTEPPIVRRSLIAVGLLTFNNLITIGSVTTGCSDNISKSRTAGIVVAECPNNFLRPCATTA